MLWNVRPSPSVEYFSLKVGKTEFYIVAEMINKSQTLVCSVN